MLTAIAALALAAIFIAGWRVLFNSPDLYTYYRNRETFYTVAIVGTIVYFVVAYGALQRRKLLTARYVRNQEKSLAPLDTSVPGPQTAQR